MFRVEGFTLGGCGVEVRVYDSGIRVACAAPSSVTLPAPPPL